MFCRAAGGEIERFRPSARSNRSSYREAETRGENGEKQVRHVSMRPVIEKLKADKADTDVDTSFARMYACCCMKEGQMKKRIWLAIFVLLLGSAISCQKKDREAKVKPGEGVEADVAAIKALIAEWVDLYNAEDFPKLISAFYAENAILMNPNGPAHETKETILLSYQKWSELNIEHVVTSVVEDLRVCGDWAFGRGMDTGTTTPRSGGAPVPYSVKWLMVFERQPDGAWKCRYEMWNDNSPVAEQPKR
jgi:ketosteroid isomerase-like protein